ncbi:MAG: YidC/Oxa1 family membrane protein insertase [Eubacteriales bacterium]|nr:YidC/Oxa1 family membrane protein insertase [Eubacteriales bacterium]
MTNSFFLTKWFLLGMQWVYSNVGDVVLTILISTILIRLITVFSDIKTRKSSAGMARIQPQIQRLQERYKNNPQKLQQEQSKLMKKEGVSMFGSCLPLLITMPIFFCIIYAFRAWGYEHVIQLLISDNPTELFASCKFLWVHNIWQPDNGMSPVIQDAAQFLATKNLDKLIFLDKNPEVWQRLVDMGLAVVSGTGANGEVLHTFLQTPEAIAAYNAILQPCVDMYAGLNNGWFILPVLAGGLGLLSSWVSMRGQPKSAANDQAQATSKIMMYMMPVMFFIACLQASAAFSIYWVFSSVLSVAVTLVINKVFKINAAAEEDKKA